MSRDAEGLDRPLDCRELCLRVRFSLDEPAFRSEADRKSHSERLKHVHARARRELLRVSATLMPELHGVVAEVSDRLLVDPTPEVFIDRDPDLNAGAFIDGKDSFVALNSGLVNQLSPIEIGSVIGHEFAHIALDHQSADESNEVLGLLAFERSRASEVSCDRVALLACRDLEAVFRANMKIATGLDDRHLAFDVQRFLGHAHQSDDGVDPDWEAESTHPGLHFRCWAIERFSRTDRYRQLIGLEGGVPFDEVERQIEDRFLAIAGGVAFRTNSRLLHGLLTWAGVLLVVHDERVSDEEKDILVRLVGVVWADDAVEYQRRHGTAAVERRFEDSLKAVRHFGSRSMDRMERAIRDFAGRTNLDGRADEILSRIRAAAKPG